MTDHQWDESSVQALYEQPFFNLIQQAWQVHQATFPECGIEVCQLLNIKTGACPEDCGYCAQSGHHNTDLEKEKLVDIERVLSEAQEAKARGVKRFCMGAAWRNPPKKDFPKVLTMIKQVKGLGLETCVTLGMLDEEQVNQLKEAGLDYYNHNLDTSPEYYDQVVTTRTYQNRIDTLKRVSDADIHVCCGGIMGLGEARADRISFLLQLSKLAKTPDSIPINRLTRIPNTPLGNTPPIDSFEFIRTIAAARIMFPTSMVRLSAGRDTMTDEMQAWCFMAGANSIFAGEKLLTTPNPHYNHDQQLFDKLGIETTLSTESPEEVAI